MEVIITPIRIEVLLQKLGYGTRLIKLPDDNHMALGVWEKRIFQEHTIRRETVRDSTTSRQREQAGV